MLKFSQVITNCLKNTNRPLNLLRTNKLSRTTTIVAESKNQSSNFEPDNDPTKSTKSKNSMVAAAFASLHSEKDAKDMIVDIKTPIIDQKLSQAQTISDLLSISEGNGISRRYALKVVSILAEWTASGKVKIADFDSDLRFIKICRILTKNNKAKPLASRSEDLSTILNVTADDEAARLVESITLPQMVKVMSTLAMKKRRSTLLLRSLAYNISASSQVLNLKQCGDLLFSICSLNFYDENLVTKVSADICNSLRNDLKKSSVVGSIITSVGLLRYKNPELLDVLSEWILEHNDICRQQDIFGLFQTLAVLNYTPNNSELLYKTLVPQLKACDVENNLVWLEIVWSLMLLNQAPNEHIESILNDEFVNKLEGNKSLSTSTKLKLLNINAAAEHLLERYKGVKLPDTSTIHNVDNLRSKEKVAIVESMISSLKNLIQSETNLKTNISTGLGFYIDAKCLLDKKYTPVPINIENESNPDITKVAILVFDYYDMCRGKISPTGISDFAIRVLQAQGYKVLSIPYTDFRPQDKLVRRVQYIESRIKQLVT